MPPPPIQLGRAALAFRGYNVTNLGRSRELLAHRAYGPFVARTLRELSAVSAEALLRPVDLVELVRAGEEPGLDGFGESIALILAMEVAQLEAWREFHGVDHRAAAVSFGYSLGEIGALIAGGVLEAGDALRIPLVVADDCAALAEHVKLGVLFNRNGTLPLEVVERVLLAVNEEGDGVAGISAFLSPNSLLVMGQGTTLNRLLAGLRSLHDPRVQLRRNEGQWAPLHTPIIWQRQVPNRAGALMHTLRVKPVPPHPPVLSMVTGKASYHDRNTRALLQQWVDHPQRLWDVVCETLSRNVNFVVHVGPEPNLIPATFRRLAENVRDQTRNHFHLRALSAAARRRWLQALLPEQASLLRAPYVQQLILEDWLLEHEPP